MWEVLRVPFFQLVTVEATVFFTRYCALGQLVTLLLCSRLVILRLGGGGVDGIFFPACHGEGYWAYHRSTALSFGQFATR